MAAVADIEKPIPVGVYTLRLVGYGSHVSQHRGTDEPRQLLRLTFEIDEGPHSGSRLYDHLPLDLPYSDRAYPKYEVYAKAFGYSGDWPSIMQWIRDGYKCVGMTVRGVVRQRSFEGRAYPELSRVERIDHNITEPMPPASHLESINFRCPMGCGELLTVPAEMVSNEPASSGAIVATVRITGGATLEQHLLTHWDDPIDG